MNMKKTIAAVAAASVAVSAMATLATSASAVTLHYNLIRQEGVKSNSGATITATYSDVTLVAGGYFVIRPVFGTGATYNTGDYVNVKGTYYDGETGGDKRFNEMLFTKDTSVEGYSVETEACIVVDTAHATATDPANKATMDANTGLNLSYGDIVIPVRAQGAGTAVSLVESTRANITVTYTYKNVPGAWAADLKAVNNAIRDGNLGLQGTSVGGAYMYDGTTITVAGGNTGITATTGINASKAIFTASGNVDVIYSTSDGKGSVAKIADDGSTTNPVVIAAMSEAIPDGEIKKLIDEVTDAADINYNKTAGTIEVKVKGIASNKVGFKTSGTDISTNFPVLGAAVKAALDGGAPETTTSAKVTIKLGNFAWRDNDGNLIKNLVMPTGAEPGDKVTFPTAWDGTAELADETTGQGVSGNGNGDGVDLYTYKTTSYTSNTGWFVEDRDDTEFIADTNYWNILAYLQTHAVNDKAGSANVAKYKWNGSAWVDAVTWGDYGNVTAVINDAVQNYDVEFVFNTTQQRIRVSDGKVVPSWDNSGTEVYKQFGQNLYPLYGYLNTPDYVSYGTELTDYAGIFGWSGTNLFSGALVVNGYFTMGLNATENFDWLGTSLSFSWDDILDAAANANISNPYALYIQSLSLVTSTTWFWDSMDVVLTEKSADDASADAGIGSDDETVPEFEEEEEEEEEANEPEEEEKEPEDTANEVVSNPVTGNASVALAVIPVALAAAAVVAKKRG